MHHQLTAKVQYDGQTWQVAQIQPDNQLVYLNDPNDTQKGVWMREVGHELIPYDIREGKPLIEIPSIVETEWLQKDVKLYGDAGRPELGGADRHRR